MKSTLPTTASSRSALLPKVARLARLDRYLYDECVFHLVIQVSTLFSFYILNRGVKFHYHSTSVLVFFPVAVGIGWYSSLKLPVILAASLPLPNSLRKGRCLMQVMQMPI